MFLLLLLQARNKKNMGQIETAKSWSVAAIICNILSMLLGVGVSIAVGVYYRNTRYRYYPYG